MSTSDFHLQPHACTHTQTHTYTTYSTHAHIYTFTCTHINSEEMVKIEFDLKRKLESSWKTQDYL